MEFLLEINVEEMPSSHVRTAIEDLRDRFEKELAAAKIPVKELRTYSTCRRLVVVAELAEGQEAREQIVTGPPKAVAFAADGAPTAAALGFARSRGIDVARLEIITTEKGEYVGFRRIEKGRDAAEILARIVPQVIGSLSFPKMMRWGEGQLRFSRPMRNILCLLGGKIVPFVIDGLASSDTTTGHKIRSPQKIAVTSFEQYRAALKEHLVTVDAEERKTALLAQIENLLAPLKAQLYPDPELLNKLANDVECPLVIMGVFPELYLDLPLEILSTAMREGQKLFSVVRGRKQLPCFLGVADMPADTRGFIQKGNERVLKARLEDARFFWEQDLKLSLKKRAPALKHVLFQEKLGSYDDKTQRLKKIATYLCGKIEDCKDAADVAMAAEYCKTDLVTDMVREFPSLQGKVGGLYARVEGLPADVSQAIYEHYQPVGLDDESPLSLGGAILSIADKLDSIIGVVGVGVQMTGSSDPFGLRRNAQGICKIILDRKLNFSFPRLLDKVLAVYGDKLKRPKAEILDYGREFFLNRLRYIYERRGYRYDLINAALGAGLDNISHSFLRVKALDALKASPQFEPFILMAKRVNNILTGQPACSLNADLFVEKAEMNLFSTFSIVRENVVPMIAKGDFAQAQKMVFRLQPGLNQFFDSVLVMDKESRLRKNRLALLQAIRRILVQMADYSQVVVEGEQPAAKK
ncbi:MAG: glycine--tRNA ligase subunit beta [Candidatus Aminicenantes bacterium]|nr:glycine--tRNA ligase subunit beta [Candidatus Aminicenantes bacterium]